MKARTKRLMSLLMCAMLVTSSESGLTTVYAEETTETEYVTEEESSAESFTEEDKTGSEDTGSEVTEIETEEFVTETETTEKETEEFVTEAETETSEKETEESATETEMVTGETEESVTELEEIETEETAANLKASGDTCTLDVKSGTDITEELSAAVKSYKNIVIPAGTYKCKKINLSGISGITINATNAVIQAVAASDDTLLFTANGQSANGITITGGTWQGSSKAPIFRFYGTNKNISLSNLTITGSKDCGIRIKDATGVTFDNVTVSNNASYGINLDTVKNITITGGTVTNNGDVGIRIAACNTATISKTKICSNKQSGVGIDSSKTALKIDNATIEENGDYGININSSKNVTVTGNTTISSNKNCGIRVAGSEEVSIKNAAISNNAKSGVAVSSSGKLTVSDTTINNNGTGNKDYGMNLNGVTTATITKVTSNSNASHGMLITASKGVNVSESIFNTSIGGYGIYCNGKTEAVFNNVICQQNYWSGMSMSDIGTKVTVTGGKYSQNGTRPDTKKDDDTTCAGIGAYNGAALTATEVVCENNHGCGIALTGTKDKVVTAYLYGITLNNNGDHGLGCRPYANVTIS